MGPTREQLLKVTDVFYHESCPDGTAAAALCASGFKRLGVAPKFHSLQHGTEFMMKLEARPGQLFVDITPPQDRWKEWVGVAPIVLDHHESVQHITEGLGGVYGQNATHSGAMLAFDHVYGIEPDYPIQMERWREFATLAMIRDTWKKDHERWQDACAQAAALQTYGAKYLIEKVAESESGSIQFGPFMDLGHVLLQAWLRKAKKLADSSYLTTAGDGERSYKIGFFNCTEKLLSDAANELLARGQDIAVGYFYLFEDGVQKISVSIRTNGSVSGSAIAKTFGGGGHERAAGFMIAGAHDTPPSTLLSYIEQGMISARTSR